MSLYTHWKQQKTSEVLMFSEGIYKNELLCKRLKDSPFKSFVNIFSIVTFAYLLWLIILQNFKRILFEWTRRTRCTRFWTQFGVKMPYFCANRSLLSIFAIVTFIYLYYPTIMQNFRNILNVDSENKKYETFLAQNRIKMSHLEAKKSLFMQYSLFSPLFTNNALSCCKTWKILGPKLTHGKNDPYWATGNFFQKLSSTTFFRNMKNNTTACKISKMLLG